MKPKLDTELKVPFAPEAEQALLGAIMLDGKLPDGVALEPSHFYAQSNREIFLALIDLTSDPDASTDPISVITKLRQKDLADKIQPSYVSSLTDGALKSNVGAAARDVIITAQKREIWIAAQRAADEALNGAGPAQILADLQKATERIGSQTIVGGKRWPALQPLPGGHISAPALRKEMVPGVFRLWIVDVAERMQVPIDYVAIPAVISFAAVIGAKIRVRPKKYDDWTIVPNLWGGVCGDPGMLKSPSIEQATRPLKRLVATAEERLAEQMKQYALDKEIDEERRANLKKRIKAAIAAGEDVSDLKAEMGEPLEPPTEKRYLVNDSSVEKLGDLLASNKNGLLLFRDELTGWLRNLDKEGNSNERSFYLESWNGGQSYVYDRIGRGTLKIPNNTMSVLGGIQPGPLIKYIQEAQQSSGGADGLIQRFQALIWPDEPPIYIHIDRWPDNEAKNRAFRVFEWADGLSKVQFENSEDDYAYLRFDDQAQPLFDSWYTENRNRLRGRNLDLAMKSHLDKFGSLFATLALLFHLIDYDGAQQIPAITLNAAKLAMAWCDYFEGHARKIYGIQAGEADEAVIRLAEKLKARKLQDGFQIRDIQQRCWAGLTDIAVIYPAVDVLCNLNWLEKVEVESKVRGGKLKTIFNIHPDVEIQ